MRKTEALMGVVLAVLIAGCDKEDPCVQDIEDTTRALLEAPSSEELADVGDDTFGYWAALALYCSEHDPGSVACATAEAPVRVALEEQLACLEKR